MVRVLVASSEGERAMRTGPSEVDILVVVFFLVAVMVVMAAFFLRRELTEIGKVCRVVPSKPGIPSSFLSVLRIYVLCIFSKARI